MSTHPLEVAYSIPLSQHWNLSETEITLSFAPAVLSHRIETSNQLIDYRALLILEDPHGFNSPEEVVRYQQRLQASLGRAHYLVLSDGQQLVAFERPVEIPVRFRLPPSKFCSVESYKRAKKLARKSRPLKIASLVWSYNDQKPVRFDHIALSFAGGRFQVPFTFEEISKLEPGQVLHTPFPMRRGWDSRYAETISGSYEGCNALVDGCDVSIPWFPPKDWTREAFANVRGLASIPVHVYESFRDFLIGRTVLSVSGDNFYDPEVNIARKLTSANSGHCYNGSRLEIVGRRFLFWEEHPEYGPYFIVDSIIHGVGLRVYAYHEHALSAAKEGGSKNPNWWKPRCLYRRVHDDGRHWETQLGRFMSEKFAPLKRELDAALR